MNAVGLDPVSQWQILHRVAQSQHHSQPLSAGKGCQCQCQLFPPGIIIMTDQNSRPRRQHLGCLKRGPTLWISHQNHRRHSAAGRKRGMIAACLGIEPEKTVC